MVRTLAFFLLVTATTALAQGPSADWRTIETAYFRVHYPVEYEEWSTRAASRLESIRTEVSREIGFTPPQKIDVLVANPYAEANGVAWTFLDTPRMIFFAEPPGPDEQIGAYGHWIDLLAVHEVAHLVHMLRPTRNPMWRLVERWLLPLNPITLGAPRWVLEGYATVVEGRLTGAGRPTSTIRALVLRQWAQNGRLPTYAQLDSDRRFLGMSMAYLMGSAYLEWLEQRGGPDSLRNLWSRLTARQRRSFDEAFLGVFGESPERLYGQFVAEVTASAVAIDRAGELQEGELFQETTRGSGDPAVSPDGTQIAVVLRPRDLPPRLVIWSTGPPTEEEKKYEERLAKIFARDPEDVRPVRAKPLPRKAVHELVLPDGGDIESPRWTRDGKAVLFSHRNVDREGFLHWDLHRWDFERLTRVTRLADVRDADPLPDARTAVAVRSRNGATQLVNVDLLTGAVTPRTDASIDVVRTTPRVSPDGTRLAHVAHERGAWSLVVDDRVLTLPGDAASPEWLSNDELVVTLFTRGFAELHRVRLDGTSTQLTRTRGGAFDVAPAADGRLFFMSLQPDGYVLRVTPASATAVTPASLPASFVPAIPPQPTTPTAFTTEAVTSRPYGLGRQERSWFSSTNFAPDQRALELGIRLGDVVGRLDALLIGSLAQNDAPSGLALATAWRGWPVELQAHAFTTDDDTGGELRALYAHRFPLSRFLVEGGASDELLFASASFTTRQNFGTTRIDEGVRLDVDDEHYRAIATAAYRTKTFRVAARYQRDGGTRVTLGGIPSSILPRSAYAHTILDPALPVALLNGDEYDGWRIESSTRALPVTFFYQRHELDAAQLSLAGVEAELSMDANPILKLPGVDVTLGVARLLDAPLQTGMEDETKWWFGMRWRP